MTQEEFKILVEVAKDAKNVPNMRLEQTMDQLSKEFEITPSEVVSGLLVKYCLDNLTKDIKVDQNPINKQIKT